ncbi:MAG: BatA domain-containing protein [Gemmataceae bacterium]|nr:BatA domain-containing protein [Gemmataceae bacterium]
MTFIFPILLSGLALAAIPVLLHLMLRQKPKTVPFPAFRFLVQKHRMNLRKLRLRHLFLLGLRIFLIAALCVALARPKLFHDSLHLHRDRPIAAIIVVDTGPTMDYRTSDQVSRLDDAKARCRELVHELPDGSRVILLSTAAPVGSHRGEWQTSLTQVRQQLEQLTVHPASASLPRRLEEALRLFATAARSDDPVLRTAPRLLVAVSDRTVATWAGGSRQELLEALDQLPPTPEGLRQFRDRSGAVLELVKQLRTRLPPPAGSDYPDAAFIDAVAALRERLPELDHDRAFADEATRQLLLATRRQARGLIAALARPAAAADPDVEDYRRQTVASLHELVRQLMGLHAVYLDVGIDPPVDVALLKLDLPRQSDGRVQQVFASEERFVANVTSKSFGRDVSVILEAQLDKEKLPPRQLELRADVAQTVPIEIDLRKWQLAPGGHSLAVRLTSKDALESNNQLFAAFEVRRPKRLLVLADRPEQGAWLDRALQSLGETSEIKTSSDHSQVDWSHYDAVFLVGLAKPAASLWQTATAYVQRGGSLAVVPGGSEMDRAAYNQPAAQGLMPGVWQTAVLVKETEARSWNWDADGIFQHPMLRPFLRWKADPRSDLFDPTLRRWVQGYWPITPDAKASQIIIRYDDPAATPAVLERTGLPGKVIVFTTPLDARTPRWNNYLETNSSFYVALAYVTTRYLTGEEKGIQVNFVCGIDEPRLPLPLTPRLSAVTVQGSEFLETVPIAPEAREVRFRDVFAPGIYEVYGQAAQGQPSVPLGHFSINLAPEKGDLTRVPASEIESIFGAGAMVVAERGVDLRQLLRGQWNEPLELFPYLMIALLFVLAMENLLANKFYRRED